MFTFRKNKFTQLQIPNLTVCTNLWNNKHSLNGCKHRTVQHVDNQRTQCSLLQFNLIENVNSSWPFIEHYTFLVQLKEKAVWAAIFWDSCHFAPQHDLQKFPFCPGKQWVCHPGDNTWQCLGGKGFHQNMSTDRQFTTLSKSRINQLLWCFWVFCTLKILKYPESLLKIKLMTKSLGGFSHDYTFSINRTTVDTAIGLSIE